MPINVGPMSQIVNKFEPAEGQNQGSCSDAILKVKFSAKLLSLYMNVLDTVETKVFLSIWNHHKCLS